MLTRLTTFPQLHFPKPTKSHPGDQIKEIPVSQKVLQEFLKQAKQQVLFLEKDNSFINRAKWAILTDKREASLYLA